MVIRLTTDYEALARDGVSRNVHDLGALSWRAARRRVGAMPRLSTRFMPPHPSFAALASDAHWGPWTRERPLLVLLDPVTAGQYDGSGPLSHVLWVASEKPALVRVLTFADADCEGAVPIRILDANTGASIDLGTDELPDFMHLELREHGAPPRSSWRLSLTPNGWTKRRWQRAGQVEGATSQDVRRRRLAILAEGVQNHESEFDLLVTADTGHLTRRWLGVRPTGVVSPNEAQDIVSTLLRTCAHIPLPCHGGTITQSFHQFAGAVAAVMMPSVHRAQISCLAPSQRESHENVADLLESLITRQSDLVRATQHLEEMNYLEGYYGGSFGLMSEQFYHLQNALVLASGSVDMLAGLLAILGEVPQDPHKKVSWGSLLNSHLGRNLKAHPTLGPIATTIRAHRHRTLLDLTYELRSVYQHRHPLRGCLGAINDRGDHMYYKSLVCLAQNVEYEVWEKKRFKERCHTFPGIIATEYDLYLVPHEFVRGITRAVAEMLDETIGQLDWPDSEWVEPSESIKAVERERLVRLWP